MKSVEFNDCIQPNEFNLALVQRSVDATHFQNIVYLPCETASSRV